MTVTTAKKHPLGIANARHNPGWGPRLRIDQGEKPNSSSWLSAEHGEVLFISQNASLTWMRNRKSA